MRSFAVYQIVATLAALALFTLPSGTQALPVRGALGQLGTRARAAKRASFHNAAHSNAGAAAQKRFKIATASKDNALPVNPKQEQLLLKKTEKKPVSASVQYKRDAGVVADPATVVEAANSDEPSQGTFAMAADTIVADMVRPSGAAAVVQHNVIAPVDSSSSSDSEAVPNAPDAQAIYASYVANLNDPTTVTETETVTQVTAATAFQVAAVAQPSARKDQVAAAPSPDAQAIYNSYIAQMNAAPASAS